MKLDFNHGVPAGDWTSGEPAIRYQTCSACSLTWYFHRPFCPGCGARSPSLHMASGRGTVYATTVVKRAPSRELASQVPYCIVLVDAREGFRLMAHGDLDLQVGDEVAVSFKPFGGALIPYFSRTTA